MFVHHGDGCRIVAMHCVAGHLWCTLGGRASTTSTERMRELRPVTWPGLVGLVQHFGFYPIPELNTNIYDHLCNRSRIELGKLQT